MWYGPNARKVYEWAGWAYDLTPSNLLWSFEPDNRGGASWVQEPTPSVDGQSLTPPFGSAFTSSPTHFYAYGGVTIPPKHYPNTSMPGLTQYDLSSKIWSNVSAPGAFRSGYNVLGQATFMPNFGKAGLLVFLGGQSPPNRTFEYEAGTALVPMSNVTIYDIDSNAWYSQNATGSVPLPRDHSVW